MSDAPPPTEQSASELAVRPIQKGDIGICFYIQSVEDIDVQKETVTVQADIGFFVFKDDDGQDEDANVAQIKKVKDSFFFRQADAHWDDDEVVMLDCALKDGVIGGEVGLSITIKVDMKYEAFPFDVQTIPMLMYLQDRTGEIYSAEHFFEEGSTDCYARGAAIIPTALISEEWTLASAAVVYEDTDPHETMGVTPQAGVYITLKRKGAGYMKRFVSITTMISASAFLPLMIPQMAYNDILAHQVGLLFAVVGFQLLISSLLPPTSTLSVLDQYTIALFLFIFCIMFSVSVEAYSDPDTETMDVDTSRSHFFWTFSLWLVGHIIFAARALYLNYLQKTAVFSRPAKKEELPILSIRSATMQKDTAFHSKKVFFGQRHSEHESQQ
jgi:hypothetical protein